MRRTEGFCADGRASQRNIAIARPSASGEARLLRLDSAADRRRVLARLAERIQRVQARWRTPARRCPSGLAELDAALGGGFACGAVHELLAPREGSAAYSLALWVAARAATGCPVDSEHSSRVRGTQPDRVRPCHPSTINPQSKWLLYIDTTGDFYPPGAVQLGLPLERLLVIRTRRPVHALWAAEQALRCSAIAATVLPLRTLEANASRRLQLAAEAGGGLGLIIRSDARGTTFSASRLRVEPAAPARDESQTDALAEALLGIRRLRITVLKLRDSRPGEAPVVVTLPPLHSHLPDALSRSQREAV